MIGLHLIPAEVAPAAPGIGGVAVGAAALFTFLAFLACAGMRQAWAATIGYGLRWVANEIRDVGIPTGFFGHIHPFGAVADALEAVDHHVAHALAVAALNCEHAAVYLWHVSAEIFVWTAHEIARLALDTYNFALGVEKVWLPHLEHRIRQWAGHFIHAAIATVERSIHRAVRSILHDLHVVETKLLHAVRAVAGTLDQVIPRVHGLERDFTGLKARLEKIEKTLAPGALVALIGATVFTHFGLEWLRCKSNPFMHNKNACGLWTALSDLLGLATAALVLEGVCEFLPLIEAAFGAAVGPVVHLLTEVPLGKCEKPKKGWATPSVAAGPLPPAQTLGPLAR